MNFIKENKKTIILMVLVVIATAIGMYFYMKPKDVPKNPENVVSDVVINKKTSLEVVPKTSATDNDLEITQRYKANINGATVEVPVVSKGVTMNGTKAVVTQEVDMTKVVNAALTIEREKVKQEFKKNWEISTGVGSHEGDVYIPVELQRNYAKDKAVSVELHLDAEELLKARPRVDGWEVKHTWKF